MVPCIFEIRIKDTNIQTEIDRHALERYSWMRFRQCLSTGRNTRWFRKLVKGAVSSRVTDNSWGDSVSFCAERQMVRLEPGRSERLTLFTVVRQRDSTEKSDMKLQTRHTHHSSALTHSSLLHTAASPSAFPIHYISKMCSKCTVHKQGTGQNTLNSPDIVSLIIYNHYHRLLFRTLTWPFEIRSQQECVFVCH